MVGTVLFGLALMQAVASCSGQKQQNPQKGEDVLLDVCFGGDPDPSTVNEYGFRRFATGSQFGQWVVEAGQVDLYWTPVAYDAVGWAMPNGASKVCRQILDINGEGAATVSQTLDTIPNATYRLSFAFAGDGVPPSSPHHGHGAYFKTMSVLWNGESVGDVFVNTDRQDAPGVLEWDHADYTLVASGDRSTIGLKGTTEARTALAVTDFHLRFEKGPDADDDWPFDPVPPASPSSSPSPSKSRRFKHRQLEYWSAFFLCLAGLMLFGAAVVSATVGRQWLRDHVRTSEDLSAAYEALGMGLSRPSENGLEMSGKDEEMKVGMGYGSTDESGACGFGADPTVWMAERRPWWAYWRW